jgi:hypothetical protein
MENEINDIVNGPTGNSQLLTQSPESQSKDLFDTCDLENIDFNIDQIGNKKIATDLQKMNKKMETVMKDVRKDLFHKLNEMSKDIKIITEFSSAGANPNSVMNKL